MKKLLSMLLVLTMFASMFASTAFAVTDSSFDRQTICLDIQTEALKQDARSLMPVDFQFQEKNDAWRYTWRSCYNTGYSRI